MDISHRIARRGDVVYVNGEKRTIIDRTELLLFFAEDRFPYHKPDLSTEFELAGQIPECPVFVR